MKGTRKRRQKKNLFDDEDEDTQPQEVKEAEENKKQTNNEYDLYDPAKLEENQIYINKKQNNHDPFKFEEDEESPTESKPKPKRERNKTKKKNLFLDSDEEEGSEKSQKSLQEESKLQELDKTQNHLVKGKTKQKVLSDEDSLTESQQQQQEEQENHLQKMVQKVQQEKQVKEVSFQKIVNEIGKNLDQRKKILTKPLEIGFKANFFFRRQTSGFSQVYQLLGQDQRPLIFCENQRGSIGANFYFSLTKQMDKKNEAYIGKLRGNAAGSTYQLYDAGSQPNKSLDRQEWRTSLAFIDYENNFMGMNGPRKFRVIVPNFENSEDLDAFKFAENENLSMFQSPIITQYRNKQPRWNQRLKSYALNFGGRVKQASIKNFIMIDNQTSVEDEPAGKNVLVFGKIDDNTFSLEFSNPISPFQAFGIAVSQFDFKLNCQ